MIAKEAASPLQILAIEKISWREDTPPDVRFLAPENLTIVDTSGRDYFPSFTRSFKRFALEFKEYMEPKIDWFPRIADTGTDFRLFSWWDEKWKFSFLAEPVWRIHSQYGGPLNLGNVDDLPIDKLVIVILVARHFQTERTFKGGC